jgi:hypothetical protein
LNKIVHSLMMSFRDEHMLDDSLADDVLFEHFASYYYVASKVSTEFTSVDLVASENKQPAVDAVAVVANGQLIVFPDEISQLIDTNGYLDVDFIFIQTKRSEAFSVSVMGALWRGSKIRTLWIGG